MTRFGTGRGQRVDVVGQDIDRDPAPFAAVPKKRDQLAPAPRADVGGPAVALMPAMILAAMLDLSYTAICGLGGRAMNANKALWEKGDFTRIAASMRDSGTALVARIGVEAGQKVLDLGCGDGTTAVPAARLGANVLGVDIASNLVAAGNSRAIAENLPNLRFQEGDASSLSDLEDRRFDLVISIFGAMFAPAPYEVAKEMVRVTRHGGRIVMGNWIPNDPTLVAQVLKISSTYSPAPPSGFVSPMLWGQEDEVVARFVGAGIATSRIACERDIYSFEYPGPPAALLDDFLRYYGPTMNAVEAADRNGRADQLKAELLDLFTRQNSSGRGDVTAIKGAFLRVTVLVD